MILRGWIIGWTIQLVVAVLVWLPLIFIGGWEGSWARAWSFGGQARIGAWLAFLTVIVGTLLLGQVENATRGVPGVRDRLPGIGPTRTAGAPGEESNPTVADVDVSDASVVRVYDYTTVGTAWTPLIVATVAEFNDVRPASAPQLVYVTAPGDTDCLDISNQEVWELNGIIICDTRRPEDFPYDPNAPVEGWDGVTQLRDDDTVRIVLNNFVPDGYYRPDDVADNTVCHEMMHAYLRGVEDNYDSDANSCIFGNQLSPGTTDVRLMRERWPTTVVEPATEPTATPHRSRGPGAPTATIRSGCDPAYPETRTCIPPGPPFDQGCAITNERLFTVLPPDPQRLDRDRDGIGCEPIVSN